MVVTKVQQTQVSGTLATRVSDSVSNANLLKTNRTIEDDLNSLRTQVKLIMGTTAWTDNLSGSQDLADIYAGLRVNGATGVANFQNDVYAPTNLFVSGSSIIAGDLTVNGTTTTINTTNLEVKDSIIGLGFASGTIQQAAGDRGWIGGISGGQNVASFWDDSASEFVFARTTNSATASLPVTIASYANMRAAVITGSVINATTGFSGSLTKLTDGTSYIIAGSSNITVTTGSNGAITLGFSSTGLAPSNEAYLVLGTPPASLTNERAFTAGTGLTGTDAGANSTYTLAINNSVVATVSGTTFTGVTRHNAGLSGSLTKLTDGTSYLIAGSNVTITTGSTGAVTIAATSTATTPASPTNSVQYNNGGVFGGSANFTFNGSSAFLTGTFAQGEFNVASGAASHAEGGSTTSSGANSHAEGSSTIASAAYAHAEGESTIADGYASHAEGSSTITKGSYSHAAGLATIASGSHQNVVGKYNKRNNIDSLFIVGNGSGDANAQRDDIFLINSGSVLVGSASLASDTFFYVGTKGAANTALFAGNVHVSGTLKATLGLSGSLTRLIDGTPYLIAGSGITTSTGSNGAITITNSSAAVNTVKGYLLGNSAHINTGTGVITFGPSGANIGTLSTATDEYIDVYLNGVYLAFGYDVTNVAATTVTLDSTITSTFTSDDIISITLRNFT